MTALVKRYDKISPDGPAHFPVAFEKTKRLWLNEPNIAKEELAKISAPTMVMAGDRDAIPMEHTLEMFRSIKGAKLLHHTRDHALPDVSETGLGQQGDPGLPNCEIET
jgi:pimeloyl-ACP methyl ester carboxylesterase